MKVLKILIAKYQEDREVFDALPSKKPKLSKLKKAQLEYKNKISEKERLKKEREERRKEIEMKKKFSKERRFKRQIHFTQKTKKGQPLMKSRMKILLEDVEKLVSKD
ncbi:hypothetical protein Anas_12267 [Armadillidium nasatum]|uniref:rRNA-processing protein FYV7 n=1 Tax=Armadillidium nasatum TaxID=96803 RepID=A0A5N5T0E1_9CRUS|nr:hypothetical protein Anas_12267 [Armadillidium nasatum]